MDVLENLFTDVQKEDERQVYRETWGGGGALYFRQHRSSIPLLQNATFLNGEGEKKTVRLCERR